MGAITVINLGKAYKQYPSRWARLREWLIPGHPQRHTLKWVLQDLNFTVNAGEAVGIIGVNGAGKSTLLKLITGTSQPSTGSALIRGRVAALLELGMGFHPDFTGRQNAYMAGQLLGYSVKEVAALMPEIEAFAEIGDYIDQPVRTYSSGMQMRLAFSVATARRPDVLIVDEALSVGDTYYQHKSFDRIRKFQREGTTLLLVSHDHAAIQSICTRALLLDKGRIRMQGEPMEILDFYNALIADRSAKSVIQNVSPGGRTQTISGTQEVILTEVKILNCAGAPLSSIEVGMPVELQVAVRVNSPVDRLTVGYMIKDRLGCQMNGTNTHHLKASVEMLATGEHVLFSFYFPMNLGEGGYSISIALAGSETHIESNYEWRDLALVFDVVNSTKHRFAGCVWLPSTVTIDRGLHVTRQID